jgi:hypothetical protein
MDHQKFNLIVEKSPKVDFIYRIIDHYSFDYFQGYRVTFTPTAPGDYLIAIKFAGTNIAGSPFKCTVGGNIFEI